MGREAGASAAVFTGIIFQEREHLEGPILSHLVPPFCPSGKTEGTEEAENKRGGSEEF